MKNPLTNALFCGIISLKNQWFSYEENKKSAENGADKHTERDRMKIMNEAKLQEMERFIREYIRDNNGDSPKFSQILQHMGMQKSVGYRYLTTLRDRGVISYKGRETLSVKGQAGMKSNSKRTPVFGFIPCGAPEDYREEADDHLALPEEWTMGDCYLLKTTGDSMIDVGIEEGDLVLVKYATSARDGQIVVALTEDGTTLKRYKVGADGRPWLMAENSSYSKSRREIRPKQLTVQGLVMKVIKNIA